MARVALYGGGGSPYNHAAILARAGHETAFVFAADILSGALDGFDAFVMPGGAYRAMAGQLEPLGVAGCRAIRQYVEAGGMYIGSCAGSYDAATVPARFLAVCPEQAELCLLDARVWNDGDSIFGVIQSPGIGQLTVRNAAPDHPVMEGMPTEFAVTHYNGPLFTQGETLTVVVGTGERFTPAEDFLGPTGGPYLIDEAISAGIANIVAGERGAGRVVLFGSHPEFGSSLAMDDVTLSARMLVNAVAWQVSESTAERERRPVFSEAPVDPEVAEHDLAGLSAVVAIIAERCARLSTRTADAPWLADTAAISMFGERPRAIWTAALDQIPVLAQEAADGAQGIAPHLVSFRPAAEWDLDGGFHGLAALLQQVDDLLAEAEVNWVGSWPGQVEDAYDYMHDSPYHLVAGSYLSAIGRVAAAALISRMHTRVEVLI